MYLLIIKRLRTTIKSYLIQKTAQKMKKRGVNLNCYLYNSKALYPKFIFRSVLSLEMETIFIETISYRLFKIRGHKLTPINL